MIQETQNPQLNISDVRQHALKWWNGLTRGQQRDYEFKNLWIWRPI